MSNEADRSEAERVKGNLERHGDPTILVETASPTFVKRQSANTGEQIPLFSGGPSVPMDWGKYPLLWFIPIVTAIFATYWFVVCLGPIDARPTWAKSPLLTFLVGFVVAGQIAWLFSAGVYSQAGAHKSKAWEWCSRVLRWTMGIITWFVFTLCFTFAFFWMCGSHQGTNIFEGKSPFGIFDLQLSPAMEQLKAFVVLVVIGSWLGRSCYLVSK